MPVLKIEKLTDRLLIRIQQVIEISSIRNEQATGPHLFSDGHCQAIRSNSIDLIRRGKQSLQRYAAHFLRVGLVLCVKKSES